jgi:uncharacterized membrane protein
MLGEKVVNFHFRIISFLESNEIMYRFISYFFGFISGILFLNFISQNNLVLAIITMIIFIILMELFYKFFKPKRFEVILEDSIFNDGDFNE